MYRGLLLNENVEIQRKRTISDGACGQIPQYAPHISCYPCRIWRPSTETVYADEGQRTTTLLRMIGEIKDIQGGDKVIRSDGTELIITMPKRPRGFRHAEYMQCWLREIGPPPTRPGKD
jgi:hypothetical protein